jgi:hypothetical protein
MVTVPTCAKNAIVFKGQPQWKVQAFCERCSTDPTNLFTMYKLETEVLQVNVAQQSPLCAAGVNITMSGATTQDLTPDMPAVHGIQAYMRAVAATLATWTGNYVAYCNGTAIDLRQPPIPLVCI